MQKGFLPSIWSQGLHLWSSTSRQGWSLEQRRSADRAPTRAPPHHELPGGLAGFPEWKPSLRSGNVPKKLQIRQKLRWQTDGPAGCNLHEGDIAALTWSLIPVAMWPTLTRRVSLMRMLRQLKSLMQTSTPEANRRAEIHVVSLANVVSCNRWPAGATINSIFVWVKLCFLCLPIPSKQQGGGIWEWLSRSTLNTCTSGWLLDE